MEITEREYNTIINKSLLVAIDVTFCRIKLLLQKNKIKLFVKLCVKIIFDKKAKRLNCINVDLNYLGLSEDL